MTIKMRSCLIATVFLMISASQTALAGKTEEAFAGRYVLRGVPQAHSDLMLGPDGRFQWDLSYGSYHRANMGDWHADGRAITLDSDPADTADEQTPFDTINLSVDSTGALHLKEFPQAAYYKE
ncbi:Hypothetical protein GbCGDNIH3_1026 [Granulibacter bethesdensis]|uniref:Secreted protein n=1 Tax=Granulibacter bethesdensis TaxID=364410 RepID=A0AAN0VFL2_9PROT|nr:hypothetical protein [Granulibacter bethesdensis]AHJ62863.1 Hypothetical protein GbCGDNIH3_1026 [Granulibacter bethesdensis]AHJ66573.1 Hypothetical protein GbCGDNIH4_1026 [Granulibacter bethesdensis CGDNIH4]